MSYESVCSRIVRFFSPDFIKHHWLKIVFIASKVDLSTICDICVFCLTCVFSFSSQSELLCMRLFAATRTKTSFSSSSLSPVPKFVGVARFNSDLCQVHNSASLWQ